MLELYFRQPPTLALLRSGSTAPYMDGFAAHLHTQGYKYDVGQRFLHAAAHLGYWPALRRVPVRAFSDPHIQAFRRHLSRCRCLGRDRGRCRDFVRGARLFLDYLRRLGIAAPRRNPPAANPAATCLIEEFFKWMRRFRGVEESTLANYVSNLRHVVGALGSRVAEYRASRLRRAFFRRARRLGRSAAADLASAIRMFLRFLIAEGRCPPGLDAAIPPVPNWRLSAIPKYLRKEEVDKVLAACNTGRAAGLRDHAILILMARLGLRKGDVCNLRLDDIDWTSATLRVSGKSGREERLPLPQEVGDAILRYLKRGRPPSDSPFLFLTARAPVGPLADHRAVLSHIAQTAIDRAGIDAPSRGTHLFRHSAATALLRQGATLHEVKALLRHRSVRTTTIYAKVDSDLLTSVAQPWPVEVPR